MQKILIAAVNCSNDQAIGMPAMFCLLIDETFMEFVKQIAKTVKELNVYSIVDFYKRGSWCSENIGYGERMSAVELAEVIKDITTVVDHSVIEVTKSGFSFSSMPHDCGDRTMLSTRFIYFDEMEKNTGEIIEVE